MVINVVIKIAQIQSVDDCIIFVEFVSFDFTRVVLENKSRYLLIKEIWSRKVNIDITLRPKD